jgi:excisionase family DNA binding protein
LGQSATISEAARVLGVSPDTVRRHIRIGVLQAERTPRGRGYRWAVELPEAGCAGVSSQSSPAAAEEERQSSSDIADELRRAFAVVCAELEARREEVRRLLSLVEQAHAR